MKKLLTTLFICAFFAFKGFSSDTLKMQNLNLKIEDGKNIFQPKNDWWDKYSSGLIAGFTVLVSLGISVWQARKSQKHSKALIISEARIEWIKNIRPLMGNLITISGKLKFLISDFEINYIDSKTKSIKVDLNEVQMEKKNQESDYIMKCLFDFQQCFYEIKLYLNHEEKSHKIFIKQVEEFVNSAVDQINSKYHNDLKEEELISSARLILKDAWEQAKKDQ